MSYFRLELRTALQGSAHDEQTLLGKKRNGNRGGRIVASIEQHSRIPNHAATR